MNKGAKNFTVMLHKINCFFFLYRTGRDAYEEVFLLSPVSDEGTQRNDNENWC